MRIIRYFLILAVSLTTGLVCATAGSLPEWARKGESYMNGKRTNSSYVFKVFKTEDSNLTRLDEGRFYPLLNYLGDRHGVSPDSMALDSLANGPGEPYTYRIVFPFEGHTGTVLAQRVDVHSAVDYNTTGNPIFEFYQLYAVSETNSDAVFDRFGHDERSKTAAALMNVVVPGAGQLYKGHTFKGAALLGSEIALGAAAITFHCRSLYYKQRKEEGTIAPESFHSEEIGLRKLRNTALIGMAGIWAFGIFDALASESMPSISVSAPSGAQLTVAPASTSTGVALVYRF